MSDNKFYEHEDYNNYEEFGPEPPEIPDEYRVCGWCEYCDQPDHPVYIKGRDIITKGGQCLYRASMCVDGERDEDILDGAVFVPFDGQVCKNFEPCAEALREAADAAEYNRDPYTYNGVSPKNFS